MAVETIASAGSQGINWGAVGQGAASIGGGLLGGLLDFPIQKSFNVKQSRHQRKWAEYMANTAYQRGVADLKAAGLNPMLAYMNANAPTGQYQTASVDPDIRLDVEKGFSSARQRSRLDQELAVMKSQELAQLEAAGASSAQAAQASQLEREARIRADNMQAMQDALIGEINARAAASAATVPRTREEAGLTAVRRRREAMAIPYSEEQKRVVAEPFQEMKRPIRKAWEAGKAAAKEQYRQFREYKGGY